MDVLEIISFYELEINERNHPAVRSEDVLRILKEIRESYRGEKLRDIILK